MSLIFSAPAVAGAATLTVLHSFGAGTDAAYSTSALATASNKLFGTSSAGGANGAGALFEYGLASGRESVDLSFDPAATGSQSRAPLAVVKGVLYGTTNVGGAGGGGTVFEVDVATHAATMLHSFGSTGLTDASNPAATVAKVGNKLWGTAFSGGATGDGAAYTIGISSAKYRLMTSFVSPAQHGPAGPLISTGGLLYGTTTGGGGCTSPGCGTIYSLDPTTGVTTVVYQFGGNDGSMPSGPLLADGTALFGTALAGGNRNAGVVFKFIPATGALSTLYAFAGGTDGNQPDAGLVLLNGLLYGTTLAGGAFGQGCVFSIDPNTGSETVVYSFTGEADGGSPYGLLAVNGVLYGTTEFGGASSTGTLYQLTP